MNILGCLYQKDPTLKGPKDCKWTVGTAQSVGFVILDGHKIGKWTIGGASFDDHPFSTLLKLY